MQLATDHHTHRMTRLRSWLALVLAALLIAPLCAAANERQVSDLDETWRLVSDRNDIQVYMRHRDDSRLKTFRGVTRMELHDEYTMVALLNDYPSYPRWLHLIDSATELSRRGPLNRTLRFTTHLPWPLTNREAVLEAFVVERIDEEEESVMVYLENRPDAIPPNKGYIRFPEIDALFGARRLGDNQVEIIYQVVMDPGGYIPAWLANMLLRDAPYFALDRMRRMLLRPEYQGQYFDYIPSMRGPGHPLHPHYDTSRETDLQ